MTMTKARPSPSLPGDLSDLVDLDTSGVPCVLEPVGLERLTDVPLPTLSSGAFLTTVQRVELPPPSRPLAWGSTNGRTVLFDVDERTGEEFQEALDAGEEPTAIVEPDHILATEIEVMR